MKKSIKFALVGALLLALVLMLGSCNLSDIPEELVGMIPDEIKNLHEHPWDEWAMVYGESDVSLVCNVCKATVKTQPFSEGLDIRDGVLYGIGTCTDKEIVVPYGVTEVAKDAFQGASIKGILLPDTLKSIGNDAFKNCQSMAVIHFPNGLEFIGERAFQNCKALVAIVLPNSVKMLGAHSFQNCQLLGAIYYYGVEEDWEKVEKGKDWNKGAGKHAVTYKGVVIAPDGPNPDHESQGLAFELNEDGQSYSVVGIGTCTDTDVVIPSKYKGLPVTAIKEGAFSECLQMHSIYIPDSVTIVEVAAFIACSSLESVRFSTNTKVIDMYAFCGSGIIELNLPNDVETIDEFAFSQCYSLKKVSIGTGLKNAGWGMFAETTSIEEVYIASDVPVGIFGRQVNLKKVTVAEGVSSIGDSAFQQCYALESVTLPNSLKHIGKLAFSDCDSLTQISIPSGIESVGVNAFGGCNALEFNEYKNALYLGNPESPYVVLMKIKSPDITSCEIADSCRVIYQIAFWACNKIESHIIIPEGVVSIGRGAFFGCSSPKIYIPSTVVHIEEGNDQGGDLGPIFRFAFVASPAYFEIHPDNQHYKSIDGCIFSKDTKTMFRYAKSNDSNEYIIPEGVERIVCFALEMATGTITVPKTVKYIEEEAFSSNITTIIYNGTVEEWNSIDKYSNWRQMNTVVTIICTNGTISEGKEINTHDHSFGDWTVTKQPSETETGLKERVCSVCGKIESEEIPVIEYKPEGSQGLEYELNAGGQSYSVVGIGTCTDTDIVFPSTYNGLPVTKIGGNELGDRIFGFEWNDKTISITIPDSVKEIGVQAFYSGLRFSKITLGNGLEIIGEDAFWGSYCEELYIPASVTTIKGLAFHEFWNMKNYVVAENNLNYKSIDGNLYSKDGKTFIVYAIAKEETTFTVPTHVTTIEAYAFCSNYNLKSIYIHSGVTQIGCEAFAKGWNLENIYYDGSVEQWLSIYNYDLLYSPSYTIYCTDGTISKDGTITYYESDVPEGSQGLEYELNADGQSYSVVGIGTCTDTDVVIPSIHEGLPVTKIGGYAFAEYIQLTSITIPDSITSIGVGAIYYCDSLTSINISDTNKYYKTIDGNLYTKDGTTLVQYIISKSDTSFTIPNGVTHIGDYAFSWCISLTSITIPESVTSIGSGAFSACYSLTNIVIPDSITNMGTRAFYECGLLASMVIPNGITSIGRGTFGGCNELRSVTIPSSVTSIDYFSFSNCSSLETIIFIGSIEQWQSINKITGWNGSSGSYTIYCTDGTISKDGTITYN